MKDFIDKKFELVDVPDPKKVEEQKKADEAKKVNQDKKEL